MQQIEQLEQIIEYSFKDRALLRQALVHRSFGEHHNERLEFLGDSLLGSIIAEKLFRDYPQAPEGFLTRSRSYLVNQRTLAEIAADLNLGSMLIIGEGEKKNRGFERPSILSDAVEALIAAIYLDGGIEPCRKFIFTFFKAKINSMGEQTSLKDSKTLLQEYLQKKKCALPDYQIVSRTGADHKQTFTVSCVVQELGITETAQGKSKRIAEQNAAKQILVLLEES